MGRLGSGVWISASLQIFVLTAGENVLGGEGNWPCGRNVRGMYYTRRKRPNWPSGPYSIPGDP